MDVAVEKVACPQQQGVLPAMRQPPVDHRRDNEERDEVETVKDHRACCDNRSTSSSVYRDRRLARDVIAVVVLDREQPRVVAVVEIARPFRREPGAQIGDVLAERR